MSARIKWTAPADNGSPITSYQLEKNSGGSFVLLSSPTGLSYIDSTALVGDQYRVRAVNAIGPGPWSATGTYQGSAKVELSWANLRVEPTNTTPRLLVKYGQDLPTVAQFGANSTLYDSRPFDGWIMIPNGTLQSSWWSSTPISQTTWANALNPMPSGLVNSQHNWISLRNILNSSIDWFDDAYWAVVTQNVANLAAVMNASGKQWSGIFFDSEVYGTYNPFIYGGTDATWTYSATAGATPGKTPTEARDKVVQRGYELMEASAAAWPTIKWWSTYTPAISEDITYTHADGFNWANNFSTHNELKGCMYYGLAKATFTAQPAAEYIDGNEPTYEVRDQARADRAKNWATTGWPNNSTHIIPSGERASYTGKAGYGPAMYDKDAFASYATHTAANLQTYLTLTMKSADRYAWLYTETHEWGASGSGKPAVTQAYIDAVAAARTAAR